jgi:hypothetical protein
MPTEVKIRKVRAVTVSGVQRGAVEDGKYMRVLTVRSEDGHIYNITLVGERAEWLELDETNTPRRPRPHGDGNKHSRGFVIVAPSSAARARPQA